MKKTCLMAIVGLMATTPALFGACVMSEDHAPMCVNVPGDQMKKNIEDAVQNPAVSVSVSDGVVTLKGNVASDRIKSDIEKRVKSMEGVKQVDNQLTTPAMATH